jgi:hypothetical protein
LSPPPYSSLDDFDEPGGPATYSPIREAGSSTPRGTVEHTNGGKKGEKRKGEEEEVEDRAELPRMIGMSRQTTIFSIKTYESTAS